MKFRNPFKRRSATPPPVQHNAAGYADRQLWNLNKLRQEVAAIAKLEGAGQYSVNFTTSEYLGGPMAGIYGRNNPSFSVYIRLAGGLIGADVSVHAPTPELALQALQLEISKRKADENEALAKAAAEIEPQPEND